MNFWIIISLAALLLLVAVYLKIRSKKNLNSEKIEIENALKHIYTSNEEKTPATFNSIKGQTELPDKKVLSLIDKLTARKLIVRKLNEFFLTKAGKKYALNIIRNHRLWEKYLAEETGLGHDKWHEEAEVKEHFMTDEERETIERKLGYPLRDPHGDPIPDENGEIFQLGGSQLSEITTPGKYKIIHVEDEPNKIYEKILRLGLFPNMTIELNDISNDELLIVTDDGPKQIPKSVAVNLTVKPVDEEIPKGVVKLTEIPIGGKCRVVKLSEKLIGPSRRRLLDLGVIPSTEIIVRFQNISGNPRAYEIKSTLIALRDDVAGLIYVKEIKDE